MVTFFDSLREHRLSLILLFLGSVLLLPLTLMLVFIRWELVFLSAIPLFFLLFSVYLLIKPLRLPKLGLTKKQETPVFYQLRKIPSGGVDVTNLFTRKMNGIPFSILYDFENSRILLGMKHSEEKIESILKGIPGLEFEEAEAPAFDAKNLWAASAFPYRKASSLKTPYGYSKPEEKRFVFEDLFASLRGKKAFLLASFSPQEKGEMESMKRRHERFLTDASRQHSTTVSYRGLHFHKSEFPYRNTEAVQSSAEKVDMCNNCLLTGDSAFDVKLIGFGEDSSTLKHHISSKLSMADEDVYDKEAVSHCLPDTGGWLLSGEYASSFIRFSPTCAEESVVVDVSPLSSHNLNDGFSLGKELLNGISETGKEVKLNHLSLNRHTIVTGLQGAGKTTLAMMLVEDAMRKGVPVIVMTPNKEWSKVAGGNSLVVRMGETPMNLARCPEGVKGDIFRLELATHLANGMEAGPYTNPLRRILISAFRELYKDGSEPSLREVYSSAGDAITKHYGANFKRGIQFDKYGQNLDSALENIREMLENENYELDGVRIEDCVSRGAVFDLSEVSKLLRPLMYSFILSQLFSYLPRKFDEKGDKELRFLLVLEEAHLVFRKDIYDSGSRKVIDELENELGSFRKHGVGLMLITHFADQLSEGLWRHCQNHFVFKQDVKGAKLAVEELAFNTSDRWLASSAQSRLLKLGQGEACCLLTDAGRNTVGPFFLKVKPEFLPEVPDEVLDGRMKAYLEEVGFDRTVKGFSDAAIQLLRDVNQHKFSPVTNRYERLGMGTKKGNNAKKELTARGFIKDERVTLAEKSFVFAVPTSRGLTYLEMLGEKGLNFWRKENVSYKHSLLQDIVKRRFEFEGYNAVIEKTRMRGGRIDVAVFPTEKSPDKRRIAVEVTFEYKNAIMNIKKDFEDGFNEVIILYEHPYVKSFVEEHIKMELEKEQQEKVKFSHIDEYAPYVSV